jgi:hypothetical protein
MSQDLNALCRQMGEVVESLRALSESIQLRHAQVDKLQDLLRGDVAVLRKDQQDLEEKLDRVIFVMQHDLEGMRVDAAANARSVNQLVGAVQELRAPVADIMTLRARAAGLILGVGVLGSAAMWLAEPIYRWVIVHNYLKQ